ncbi:MAG: ABC transporter ATP-binding protein [Thaumarchaeota archaeon]|nr:ABC transporter ATP-binding protein [Nitrososphaerota archaeon]
MREDSLCRVSYLSVDYRSEDGEVHALSSVSLEIRRKEILALVGESGCGKSTLALSIIGLLPAQNSRILSGQILFEGKDLLSLSGKQMQKIRGTGIAMIFQEPLSALHPVLKIREQLGEAISIRRSRQGGHSLDQVFSYKPRASEFRGPLKRLVNLPSRRRYPKEVEDEMIASLKLVRIPDPERILNQYPFELSGGMRQRVAIAMALSENPGLLIADEPTTALDVTTQAQVLRLMKELAEKGETSLLIITHDLGVAAQVADRIVVMYAGEVVEEATIQELFSRPLHPYTKALLACLPKGSKKDGPLGSIPGSIPDLRKSFEWCPFVERCQYAMERCGREHPALEGDERHSVSCFLYS